MFRSEVVIQLSELYFRSCTFINNHSISRYFSSHDLIEIIDLRDCNITYKIFKILTLNFPRLTTLLLGETEHKIDHQKNLHDFFPTNVDKDCFLNKTKLKYLSLEGIHTNDHNDLIDEVFYKSLTQSSEQIRFLDLSRNSSIGSLTYIECFKQIHTLILYDILPNIIQASLESICNLKTLISLDLSLNRRIQESETYKKPTMVLATLIHSLPKLISLDISGTNLAGTFSFDRDEELSYIKKELSIDETE